MWLEIFQTSFVFGAWFYFWEFGKLYPNFALTEGAVVHLDGKPKFRICAKFLSPVQSSKIKMFTSRAWWARGGEIARQKLARSALVGRHPTSPFHAAPVAPSRWQITHLEPAPPLPLPKPPIPKPPPSRSAGPFSAAELADCSHQGGTPPPTPLSSSLLTFPTGLRDRCVPRSISSGLACKP